MKLAPSPTKQFEKTRALALVSEVTQNPGLASTFPKEIEELKKYLTGEISTDRAIQLIQIIKKE